jgi:hypothetical protein
MGDFMKTMSLILAAGLLATVITRAQADTVKLTDGSSLSGTVVQQANGDYKVTTGAGEMTVEKAKVASVVSESSAAAAPTYSGDAYIKKVQERREAYGNDDGIPHSVNLQSNQLSLTLGQLNYTGDAFTSTSSDLSGISYGLAYAHSYTDFIALELWGDYSYASKDYTVAGSTTTLKLNRFNIGVGPKVQRAVQIGRVESGMVLLPNVSLSAVYSGAAATASGTAGPDTTFNSSSFGGALGGGLDFQFGGAVIGVKARYLLTTDVSNQASLKSSNTSAFIPQVTVGFNY